MVTEHRMDSFKEWMVKKFNKFHQEVASELRMMLKLTDDQFFNIHYVKEDNNDILSKVMLEDNQPIFYGIAGTYTIDDLRIDELYEIITSMKSTSVR